MPSDPAWVVFLPSYVDKWKPAEAHLEFGDAGK